MVRYATDSLEQYVGYSSGFRFEAEEEGSRRRSSEGSSQAAEGVVRRERGRGKGGGREGVVVSHSWVPFVVPGLTVCQ